MILTKTIILSFLLVFTTSNFTLHDNPLKATKTGTNESFIPFDQFTLELYNDINDDDINFEAFKIALIGYSELTLLNKVKNKKYLTVIDMSISANKERMYIIDMEKRILIDKKLVAHGLKTGSEFASNFSNEQSSHKSSIGFYITGNLYNGKHALSMRLDGMEYSNDNARSRGVVVHSADYVNCDFIESNGRLGRSYGCPAIAKEGYEETVHKLKGGSCFFIYYPSEVYLSRSKIVNSKNDYLLTCSGEVRTR